MNRVALGLLLFGLFMLVLAGCPGPQTPTGPVSPPATPETSPSAEGQQLSGEITLWTIWNSEPRRSALEDVVEGFETSNPGIKVKVSNIEPDAYKTKIRVALGSDAPPDIFFVWSGEKMLRNFVRGGNCLDLTRYLDENEGAWRSRIIASSLGPYVYEGKTYGVPYLMQCTFFFYNKDIFAAHELEIPTTWDGLTQVCQKLKDANVTPIALGNLEMWPAHHLPCVLFQRLMGHEAVMAQYDPLGPGEYSDPGWLTGLRMFDEFQKSGFFNPSPNGLSRADARALFFGEKAAMFYTGTWDFAQLTSRGEAPSTFWDKWDFFNFPSVEGGKGEPDGLAGSPDGYVVSSKTSNPAAAVAFLKFLTSTKVANEFVGKCRELVQVNGAVDENNASWYLRKYAETVQAAPVISPWTDTMMEGSVAKELMNGVQAMLAGQSSAAQVLEAVRQRQAQVKKDMQATSAAVASDEQ